MRHSIRLHARRAVTLIEFVAASSIATIIGGGILMLITSTSNLYSGQTTLAELSDYLDLATYQIRRDIWMSMAVCNTATCPDGSWLGIDITPTNLPGAWGDGDVRYRVVNTTNPPDVTLVRDVRQGGGWTSARTLARRVSTGGTPPVDPTVDLSANPLVTVTITTAKTVRGRAYQRTTSVTYRRQL